MLSPHQLRARPGRRGKHDNQTQREHENHPERILKRVVEKTLERSAPKPPPKRKRP